MTSQHGQLGLKTITYQMNQVCLDQVQCQMHLTDSMGSIHLIGAAALLLTKGAQKKILLRIQPIVVRLKIGVMETGLQQIS